MNANAEPTVRKAADSDLEMQENKGRAGEKRNLGRAECNQDGLAGRVLKAA